MSKRGKKVLQFKSVSSLSKEDYDNVCSFLVKVVSRLQTAIDDMKLSRKSSRLLHKSVRPKDLTGMYLLFRTDFKDKVGRNPKQINKSMHKRFLKKTPPADMTSYMLTEDFISSKKLSEVLKVLEKSKLFSHVESKRDLKKILGCRKVDLKGRPSHYIIPTKIVEIDNFLSRPEIIKIIIKHLTKTNVLREFIKGIIYEFYLFIIDANENELSDGFRSVSNLSDQEITRLVRMYCKVKSRLLSSNRKIIDVMAERSANDLLRKTKQTPDLVKRILLLLHELKFD
jgi:hypothetical protein